MQLPREQLKELIDKQPSIKPALYQYVVQKAGVAKAQSLADVGHLNRYANCPLPNLMIAFDLVTVALRQPPSSRPGRSTTHHHSYLKQANEIMA